MPRSYRTLCWGLFVFDNGLGLHSPKILWYRVAQDASFQKVSWGMQKDITPFKMIMNTNCTAKFKLGLGIQEVQSGIDWNDLIPLFSQELVIQGGNFSVQPVLSVRAILA
ncbi:hypothetical protein CLU79DRAFT_723108 [Phycomyces nitens]|nr:hypothetical protein CLU79DRAFT_723108 [Phycomyces nitens]